MEKETPIQGHIKRIKQRLAREIEGLDDFEDARGDTARIAQLIRPLDLRELMWYYRLFAWALNRQRAIFPKREIEVITECLRKLLKKRWLESELDVEAIKDFMLQRMSRTTKGTTLFVLPKKGSKNFPMDFLVQILALHINKRRHPMISSFLAEQGLSEVGENAIERRIGRLELSRLWNVYNAKIHEVYYVLSHYVEGAFELSDDDKVLIYREIIKPFEYFLPSEVRKSLNIDS